MSRGKKANTAITIVVRRMCRILVQLLHDERSFEKRSEGVQILRERYAAGLKPRDFANRANAYSA